MQEPPGPGGGATYWQYVNHPTLTLAQDPQSYPFTADDLTWDGPGTVDHAESSFYWGPSATGESTVSVTATFKKFDVNEQVVDTFTDSESAKFNLVRPTGNIFRFEWGTAGKNTQPSGPNEQAADWISMDKNRHQAADPKPVGIHYRASIDTASAVGPFTVGAFTVIQLQKYKETRTSWDMAGVIHNTEMGFYADTSTNPPTRVTNPDGSWKRMWDYPSLDSIGGLGVGYGFRLNDAGLGNETPVQPNTYSAPVLNINGTSNYLYGSDSPGSPLVYNRGLDDAVVQSRTDYFYDFLMYNPDFQANGRTGESSGSIWIPVGWIKWTWTATAAYDSMDPAPQWTETAASQDKVDYAATTIYPNWTANRKEAGFSKWFDV
jgi:hypothetical protein